MQEQMTVKIEIWILLRKIQKEILGIRTNVTEMKNAFVRHSCTVDPVKG